MLRFLALCTTLALIVIAAGVAFGNLVPPQDSPFEPLDLAREPGLATGMKLDGLADDPEACFGLLDQVGIAYTPVEIDAGPAACALDSGLTLDQSLTPYSATLTLSCPLAASLYVWERHVVIPAAQDFLGSEVTRIETYGAYNCRRINHRQSGPWSQHATGDAVDISGFTLADGRVISVRGFYGADTAEGRFLQYVRDKACNLYSSTLGPEYNAAHADHFHFDMGLYTSCS